MKTTKLEAFKIIGITVRTTNENGRAGTDIVALWNKFMSESIIEKIPNKIDATVYSIYTEYEGDHTKPYTTMLGCKVFDINEVPKGMVAMEFNAGNYTKFTAKGDLTQAVVFNKWTEIWEMDLDRAYTADFEVYDEKSQNPTNAEVAIYIAIKE